MQPQNNHINYIEFKANDLELVKAFYINTFGWQFTDYGPGYTAFSDSGLEGGFEKTDDNITNGVLVVLYHNNLEAIQTKVEAFGGRISKEIFSFPGGRRFQFIDPSGNELAVWCETHPE
ncbi:VOC family protein [uncultured Psychroserpens sp.]|uniref:VOC family protein n=1 Tax=uncultured Psychroserpens sp. TaxID=255436 RepID=UPI0026128A7F|nr:VOC family protein [uncultured Psychroserpens sp.]